MDDSSFVVETLGLEKAKTKMRALEILIAMQEHLDLQVVLKQTV